MKYALTSVLLLLLLGMSASSAHSATLSLSRSYEDVPEIYVGGCVAIGFEVMLSDLEEPIKELEFSMKVPDGVALICGYVPHGELKFDGENFLFTFDECLQPGERIMLVGLWPEYDPPVRGLGCLGPASPSGLGLATTGYRSCGGEVRALEVRSWAWLPEGCVDLYLDQGGLAAEVSWGMMKAVFTTP